MLALRTSLSILLLCLMHGNSLAATPQTEAGPFVASAVQAGMTEMQAAQLALQKSHNEAVRAFATQMIADHGKADAELKSIAGSKGIPVPVALDAEHARALKSLAGVSGKSFDKAYATQMVADHAKAVELFQANVVHPDSELAAFAAKTLAVLNEHKRLADNLRANLGR